MFALAGVPGMAFWWSLVKALGRHDRTAVTRLLIAATLAATIFGAIMLTVDSRSLTAEQHYSPTRWYAIWFWGVPVVGAWLLLCQGIKSLIAWRKSRK
jgi:heme/copper-type cytochrome/quinol oxidase subunit 1